jgi:DnaJ family protein A protein 2
MPDLYEVLRLKKGASDEEIRKAYKVRSLETHPDKPGGSKEEFQTVNQAKQILMDPQLRADYDATGHIPGAAEEIGHGGGGGIDLSQIFGSMFGGGGTPFFTSDLGGGGRIQKQPRGPNTVHDIGLTLSELWHGKTFTLNMNRDVLCEDCKGRGGSKVRTCSDCGGRGIRIRKQQMGPMMMMSQEPCATCRQTGEEVSEKCATCDGRCVTKRVAALDVCVKPGMQEGDRLVFPGQCSESPAYEIPGDVILVVRSAVGDDAATTWARRGTDLMAEVHLTLAESLLGWDRSMYNHPSGRPVHIVWNGGMVREAEVLRVPGWGMPATSGMPATANSGSSVGDLRIVCRISGNQGAWSEEQLRALKSVWPEWQEPVIWEESIRMERL